MANIPGRNAQVKAAAQKKEAIEISCPECDTQFRLWVPLNIASEWEKGARISCIKCGAQHSIRKDGDGFTAEIIKASPDANEPSNAERPAQAVERGTQSRPAPPKPEPPPASGEVVLVIEDDRVSREMVEGALNDIGIRLVTAKNGVEALKTVRRLNVKLIVTDLYLKNPADPEALIDGEELLKRVIDSGFDIPAIITTGKDIIDDMVLDPKWFDLKVKGFIQKGNPFWAEELKVKIKEVLYRD